MKNNGKQLFLGLLLIFSFNKIQAKQANFEICNKTNDTLHVTLFQGATELLKGTYLRANGTAQTTLNVLGSENLLQLFIIPMKGYDYQMDQRAIFLLNVAKSNPKGKRTQPLETVYIKIVKKGDEYLVKPQQSVSFEE